MKSNIAQIIDSIAIDNENIITESYDSVAEYILHDAEEGSGWGQYFSEEENDGGISAEMIEELKSFINDNYNYLPELA